MKAKYFGDWRLEVENLPAFLIPNKKKQTTTVVGTW